MNNEYKVEIFTPGKIFDIKGKLIRSPVEFIVNENELSRIKMEIEIQGILKYKITPYSKELDFKPSKNEIEEVMGEEIEVRNNSKTETILESLLKDN
jgi:hypothetical protein